MAKETEGIIVKTFIELLNEMPLDKITVRDIVDKSEISRNTFYYHFEDIPTLLNYVIVNECERVMNMNEVCDIVDLQSAFDRATEFMRNNRKAIYHIYMSSNNSLVIRYVETVAADVAKCYIENLAKDTDARREDIDLLILFFKSALFGMIINWVEAGMINEPDATLHRLASLLEGTIYRALERSTKL